MVTPIPLVSFLITLLLASAVSVQGVLINDTDGNPVKVREQYYIQPVNGTGGLFPADSRTSSNPSCPPGIFQLIVNHPGDPVTFAFTWPFSPKTNVSTYSDVTIEFNTVKGCNGFSKYWGVDEESSTTEKTAIIVGAEPTRTNSWFQIRTAGENIYELATRSGTVGIFKDPNNRLGVEGQLFLTNITANIFFVKFKKVNVVATMATRFEKLRQKMFPFY